SVERALGAGTQRESLALRAVPREGSVGLSFAQQRLWFLNELEPESTAYNIVRALRLRGALNVAALEAALTEIVRRHEALRTSFAVEAEQPVQVIATETNFSVAHISITEAEVRRFIESEVDQPFDLQTGSLFRASLLRVDAEEHVLVLTTHHIISDGWSAGVLFRELGTLYAAYAAGEESPLPELPVQYADYAVWQRGWLQGEVLDQQLVYWRERLTGAAPVLELPVDRVRPAVQSYRGAAARFEVSREVSEGLKELAHAEGVTLFMTLLAAFKVLLYRYTGQEDLSVGTLIANRTHPEIEKLIGFFVNTLVLRTDLSGGPDFRELLGRVRETALGAYAHQDVPFEKLVEELQPERNLSHTPLFQVLFVLQNTIGDELRLPDLGVSPVKVETEIAKFDLSLFMTEQEQGLKGVFVYSRDLFERETIERLLGHFRILLEAIVSAPQRSVTELPLLSDAERHQLLVEWNETEVEERWDICIHQIFEEQAARTPEATALVFEEERLSYAELNARSNQLAHHLQTLGVGPEVLVGILMERSVEMVVSLLAVLKAGGAYVPLDPQYPAERLTFMLEDSQVGILLAHRHLLEDLPHHSARVVCPAGIRKEIALESEENLDLQITDDQLAYVIYTSGSTGRPKGSLITHAKVVRLFKSTEQWFHFGERDAWTLFHSYAFDFSVWEIWGALLYGGRLVVVPYLVSRSPEAFYQLLCREQVTVLNQTPSAFHQLMLAEDSASSSKQLALRLVIFGGEALELQRLRPWLERHGDRQPTLVNMYGITETTVHVTYRPLTWSDLETVSGSVIGRPIPDLQVYLLDQHLQPVPQGVAGEIHVGGEGLARGYLNRPELTAERFIPNPFSTRPGTSLYKSGDLARYLAQGELEYLGRIDHQVKIRGFRIELGEIESMLNAHPEIREAVVMAREDEPDEKRLVAYIVAEQDPPPKITQLREYLAEKLPEYMIPAAWVYLDQLPLTGNNKVDRRALPAPDMARPDLEDAFTAPRTPVEEMIAGIWSELLGLDRVGVYDNFFELGGHSLIATQLVSRLREAFQVEILLRNVFEQPTVAELAEALQRLEQKPGRIEILAELHKRIASMSPDQIRIALESKRGLRN
ncbi:MAG TPA: amino acid adenylation domain-containing protein, partial [Pyrinomonadaceae bacterium]|nr:amino acid adenylation domain-containing protein [Pyrinomonadaceae bacterium]